MGWITRKANGDSYIARYRDPNGREWSRSFRTKAEARRFLSEVESGKNRGTWIDPAGAKLLFRDWAHHHAQTWVHLGPATRARAESLMRNHVLARFEDCRLGMITTIEVQAWVNELIAAGLRPRRCMAATGCSARSWSRPWPRIWWPCLRVAR